LNKGAGCPSDDDADWIKRVDGGKAQEHDLEAHEKAREIYDAEETQPD